MTEPLDAVLARVREGLDAVSMRPDDFPPAPNYARVKAEWVEEDGTESTYPVCSVRDLRTLLAALDEARTDAVTETQCTNPHNETSDPNHHCYHLTHALTVSPPINVSVCCHCGHEKRWQQRATGGTNYHGPHIVKPYTLA